MLLRFLLQWPKLPARKDLVFEGWAGGSYNVTFSWSPDGTADSFNPSGRYMDCSVVEGNPTQINNTPESELWVHWSLDCKSISGYIIINTAIPEVFM